MAICNFRNLIVRDIRARIYAKLLELPLRYHAGERKGDLLALITNDMHVVEYSVMFYIEMVFREPIAVLLFLATMLTLSPASRTNYAPPVAGQWIAHRAHRRKASAEGARVQRKERDLLARVETLSGIRVIGLRR